MSSQIINDINNDFAVITIGGKVKIVKITLDKSGIKIYSYLSKSDFITLMQNQPPVQVGQNNWKSRAQFWLESQHRKEFKGVEFEPENPTPGFLNLYQGFAIKPIQGSVTFFLNFLKDVICNNDQDHYDYLVTWLAHLFQKPEEKIGVALVIRGIKGVGKGQFLQAIGSLLEPHYMEISNGEHLVGKFNAHLGSLLLLGVDEAYWNGDSKAEGILKNLVTEPKITIERKGIDSVSMNSYVRVIMTTNNHYAVPATGDERRWFVLDCSNKYKEDYTYFKKYNSYLDNGGREALLHYFLNYQIPSNTELRRAPVTKGLNDQKVCSLEPIGEWWMHCLEEGHLYDSPSCKFENSRSQISRKQCLNSCNKYIKDHRRINTVTGAILGRYLKKVVPGMTSSGSTNRTYNFPDLKQLRKHFEREIGKYSW